MIVPHEIPLENPDLYAIALKANVPNTAIQLISLTDLFTNDMQLGQIVIQH